MEKARSLPCDALIFDLEDSVAPDLKPAARAATVAALAGYGSSTRASNAAPAHRELIVRINALDTEWGHADLDAASKAGPDAVLVPKIRTAQDIA